MHRDLKKPHRNGPRQRHCAQPTARRELRKDAGVVDRGGLENRCSLTGTQGSNPCLSAETTKELQATLVALFSFYHYHWNEKSDKILILP